MRKKLTIAASAMALGAAALFTSAGRGFGLRAFHRGGVRPGFPGVSAGRLPRGLEEASGYRDCDIDGTPER